MTRSRPHMSARGEPRPFVPAGAHGDAARKPTYRRGDACGRRRSTPGKRRDTSGMRRDTSGMRRDTSGTRRSPSGMRRSPFGRHRSPPDTHRSLSDRRRSLSGTRKKLAAAQRRTHLGRNATPPGKEGVQAPTFERHHIAPRRQTGRDAAPAGRRRAHFEHNSEPCKRNRPRRNISVAPGGRRGRFLAFIFFRKKRRVGGPGHLNTCPLCRTGIRGMQWGGIGCAAITSLF